MSSLKDVVDRALGSILALVLPRHLSASSSEILQDQPRAEQIGILDCLDRERRRYRNGLLPIHQLPEEILDTIMESAVDLLSYQVLSDDRDYQYYRRICDLRLVSSSWDALVVNNPRLWSVVFSHARRGCPMPPLPILVSRSKDTLLTLDIPVEAMGSLPDEGLEAVVPLVSRVRSMHLCIEDITGTQVLRCPAPRLERLEIQGSSGGFTDFGDLGHLFCGTATLLQTMLLHYTNIPPPSQTFSILQSLTLTCVSTDIDRVAQMLVQCSTLQKLELDRIYLPYSRLAQGNIINSISHPSLTHVTLRWLSKAIIRDFLLWLHLPSCNYLFIQLCLSDCKAIYLALPHHLESMTVSNPFEITPLRVTYRTEPERKRIILDSPDPDGGTTINFKEGVLRPFLPFLGTSPMELAVNLVNPFDGLTEDMLRALKGENLKVERMRLLNLIIGESASIFEYLCTPAARGGGSLDQHSYFCLSPISIR